MGWLLIIFGPPLILVILGLFLVVNRRVEGTLRRVGGVLTLVGIGQIVLTWVSFTACTPFDADPCHGTSWWASWPEVVIGWGICIAVLLVTGIIGVGRGLRERRS